VKNAGPVSRPGRDGYSGSEQGADGVLEVGDQGAGGLAEAGRGGRRIAGNGEQKRRIEKKNPVQ